MLLIILNLIHRQHNINENCRRLFFCRYQQADSKGTKIAEQFWKRRNKFLEPHYPISGLTIKLRKSRKCGIGEEYTYRSMEQNREPRNSP